MKHFLLKSSLVLLGFLILSSLVKGQENAEWTTIYDADGITFSYKIENCNGLDFILCEVSNANSHTVSLMYELQNSEGIFLPLMDHFPLIVETGQTLLGTCEMLEPSLAIPALPEGDNDLTVSIETFTMN